MNLQVCQFDSSYSSTVSQPLSSWPIQRSFKMVNLTGLWARCSSGMVGRHLCLLQVHLPMLCLLKVQQCSVHNKCSFLYFASTQSLSIPSAQRSPSGIKMYLKPSRRIAFLHPWSSVREVRLRLVLCVPICCASPCFALEPWHVYLHPNVRVVVSPVAESQCFLTNDGLSACERA